MCKRRLLWLAGILLLGACKTAVPSGEVVFVDAPPSWFEDGYSRLSISPDGRQAIYRGRSRLLLVDLNTGKAVEQAPWQGLSQVLDAVFLADGRLACYVQAGGTRSWYRQQDSGFEEVGIPSDAFPSWSRDGSKLAYFRSPGSKDLRIRSAGEDQVLEFAHDVVAVTWSPGGNRLYAMLRDPFGVSEVLEIDPLTESNRIVARGLDGPSFANSLAFDPDGSGLFLALVGTKAPDPRARHQPHVDRDLDIYRLDIATGSLDLYAAGPGDEFDPHVSAGRLFWTNNSVQESLALVPNDGGECL
ncbi:MAG: TolB family protein, partial [Planctomycetota bacterium]